MPAPATRLSYRGASKPRFRPLGAHLARLSLLFGVIVLSAFSSSCLLGDPPAYESEAQTTPVLLPAQAEPPLGTIITAEVGDTIEFRVPFRSQDAGEQLAAVLYREFQQDEQREALVGTRVAAGSNLFTDETRSANLSYTFTSLDEGCSSYTLLVTHQSNLFLSEVNPGTEEKLAFITWWANINDGPPPSNLVSECGEDL